jgi:hypothetical protein
MAPVQSWRLDEAAVMGHGIELRLGMEPDFGPA